MGHICFSVTMLINLGGRNTGWWPHVDCGFESYAFGTPRINLAYLLTNLNAYYMLGTMLKTFTHFISVNPLHISSLNKFWGYTCLTDEYSEAQKHSFFYRTSLCLQSCYSLKES